ncbi:MAG TPA: 1-acyl-sn-glycerol-3-phosphate acyltransferase [Nocardioidaceae bacterium]|nr:1-acyl-sn-glycerol-3-phosphate acyltransferase [Nocardioidaceae bacterium]
MADADIIPLGTRGRPGRGSGSANPSASARSLAGSAKKPAKPGPGKGPTAKAAHQAEEPVPEQPRRSKAGRGHAPQPPAPDLREEIGSPQETPLAHGRGDEAPEEPPGRQTSSTTAKERMPDGGIPVSDWMHAFTVAAKEIFGEDWEPRLAEFMAFLRRRITGDYTVDEYGFDREITERFFYAAIRPIADKWFRVEVRGADNIPAEGGALVVSNHSGTVPMDGLVTGVSIHDHTGRHLRPLGADLVFRLPIVGEIARKGGATLACNDDAERMLRGGELVGVWPEGFKGIGKPYSERYKLQRFGRGGFVSAALRTGVPIIPCSVVGAEEIYPLVGNLPSLARLLGVPYIPVTPFFPLLGPLGLVPLPSKWLIEFGEPIRTDSYDHGAADDPMLVFNVTDQVRETIQQTLYSLLMQRRSVFY